MNPEILTSGTISLPLELTGRARSHVVQVEVPRFAAHPRVAEAFLDMRRAAAGEGIDLSPFSSFRDFKTQVAIWNAKFLGKKPLYDAAGIPRRYEEMSRREILWAILEWSALPGASRHHWGTEIDVVDRAAMPEGYRVRLLPEEVAEGGIFSRLHRWLDDNMMRFGFFRPYDRERGGMHAEPWHLSYAEIAQPALENLTPDIVRDAIMQDGAALGIEAKDLILDELDEIFARHVRNVGDDAKQMHKALAVLAKSPGQ